MATIFTKIVNREIAANIIAEDDQFIAILDIRPIVIGHTLVIPKTEVDYVFDMEDDHLGRMMIFAKKVSHALKAVTNCKRVGIIVSGFEIPHTHVHLTPVNATPEMIVTNPPVPISNEAMSALAQKLRAAYIDHERAARLASAENTS